MSEDDNLALYLGQRGVRDTLFGLHDNDRAQHVYIVGQTGTGKSTLLHNMILQDILLGRGVAMIDPHGDLAEDLLDEIPPQRTDEVAYFNPADTEYPIGLNLLADGAKEKPHLVASSIVSAFRSIWRESWGPRLEYILYAACAALAECDNTSLLGLPRMLIDTRYRDWVLKQVGDPMVQHFWHHEFESYGRDFRQEAIAPIQNKVGQLLMAAPLRNILGQVKSGIDPRFMMDNRRILIANLSKGQLGADPANLLGSLLTTQFQLAAMSRSDTFYMQRTPFHLYIDEFQNFTTDAFTDALAEARKYGLRLTLAHQYLDQVELPIRQAVFGNVGTLLAFRVGPADAEVLQPLFEPFSAHRLADLHNYHAAVRMLEGGRYGDPFVAKTLPAVSFDRGRRDIVVARSREKYARRRTDVENRINRWFGT